MIAYIVHISFCGIQQLFILRAFYKQYTKGKQVGLGLLNFNNICMYLGLFWILMKYFSKTSINNLTFKSKK